MATEVKILGHKAKIERVSGQTKQEPWWKEEQLVVWLAFDEAVDGVLSFAIYLPVKKYERDEFLYNVRRRGEEELQRILVKNELEKREIQEKKERQAAVDAAAAEAQCLIE
ncbi:unnamed protein product [marine sediment metagenome]|uniref:Uncharacterized protein n=1 Tax=marine sediment metagenome TaxID=412755 RepID=X1TLS2_9ZZZZ